MGVYSAKKIKGSAPSAPGGGHQFCHLCSDSFIRGALRRSPAPWTWPPSLRVRRRVQGAGDLQYRVISPRSAGGAEPFIKVGEVALETD